MSWTRMENRSRATNALKAVALQQHETGLDSAGNQIYNPPAFNPLLASTGQYLILSTGEPLELTK